MSAFFALVAASTTEESSPLVGPLLLVAGIALSGFVTQRFFSKRAKATADAVADDTEPSFSVSLSPAPLMVESISRIRALYGETAPAPRIPRTVRPVARVTANGLTISERKAGILLSIPASDIVSVKAGPSRVTFMAPKYPSVWIALRHGDTEDLIALPPLLGGTQTINATTAKNIAAEMSAQLAVPAV